MTCKMLTVPIYFVLVLAGIGGQILADGTSAPRWRRKLGGIQRCEKEREKRIRCTEQK